MLNSAPSVVFRAWLALPPCSSQRHNHIACSLTDVTLNHSILWTKTALFFHTCTFFLIKKTISTLNNHGEWARISIIFQRKATLLFTSAYSKHAVINKCPGIGLVHWKILFANLITCKEMFLKGLNTTFPLGRLKIFAGSSLNTFSCDYIIWPSNILYINPLIGMFRKILSFVVFSGEIKVLLWL